MATKITFEVEIEKLSTYDNDYAPTVADKIQEDVIKATHKRLKRWHFWNNTKIKIVSLTSKVTTR